jgi:cytochrome P450 family 110
MVDAINQQSLLTKPAHTSLPDGPSMSPEVQAFHWAARPLAFLAECADAYTGEFTLHLPGMDPVVVFSHPEALRQIFAVDSKALSAGRGNDFLKPLLGLSSLLCADGENHLRMRRLVAPAFTGNRNAQLGESIRQLTRQKANSWLGRPNISFQDEISELTLDVMLHGIIGPNQSTRYEILKRSSTLLIHLTNTGVVFGERLGPGTNGELRRRLERGIAEYEKALMAEIGARRAGPARTDILGLLMSTQGGDRLNDSELRDQVLTLILAGHETTATALAWSLQALLRNTRAMARLTAELDAVAASPAVPVIEAAPYLHAVVNETLRWVPVLPAISARFVTRAVAIMGRLYSEGVYLLPCPYLTHRREDLYPQAGEFRPERFLTREFSPYEFLPFGGGVRRCIGMRFALFEMKMVLATLLREFQFSGTGETCPRPVRRRLTVAPLGGVPVNVRPRPIQ